MAPAFMDFRGGGFAFVVFPRALVMLSLRCRRFHVVFMRHSSRCIRYDGSSMVLSWDLRGAFVVLPWCFHDFFPWYFHYASVVIAWCVHYASVDFH